MPCLGPGHAAAASNLTGYDMSNLEANIVGGQLQHIRTDNICEPFFYALVRPELSSALPFALPAHYSSTGIIVLSDTCVSIFIDTVEDLTGAFFCDQAGKGRPGSYSSWTGAP